MVASILEEARPSVNPDVNLRVDIAGNQLRAVVAVEVARGDAQQWFSRVQNLTGIGRRQPDMEQRRLVLVERDVVVPAIAIEVDSQRRIAGGRKVRPE
jgi:hypothetical protein